MVGRLSGKNVQLRGGGTCPWRGKGGAKIGDVRSLVVSTLNRKRFPTTLIIHIGTNDIFQGNSLGVVRFQVEESLKAIRVLLPETRLIWSDILYRAFYLHESSHNAGKRSANNINRYVHKIVRSMPNAYYISHAHQIQPSDHSVYL